MPYSALCLSSALFPPSNPSNSPHPRHHSTTSSSSSSTPRLPPRRVLNPTTPPKSINCSTQDGRTSGGTGDPEEKPWLPSDRVKMPTAPWMRGPLLLPASDVLDLSNPHMKKPADESGCDDSLTAKVSGGRGRKAMLEILKSIAKLGRAPCREPERSGEALEFTSRLEEAMMAGHGPGQHHDEQHHRQQKSPVNGINKMPWASLEGKLVFPREKKERVVTPAELTLPALELARLRSEAKGMRKWVRAKKAGVTQEVVDEIWRAWRKGELAMVKIVEPLRRNMDRAREIVEIKTGGLVVWSKKDHLVVYRASNYQLTRNSAPAVGRESSNKHDLGMFEDCVPLSPLNSDQNTEVSPMGNNVEVGNSYGALLDLEILRDVESVNGTLYEREADRLLDGLGPRFIDWWWKKPLPVDADLLPEVAPDFKPPLRRCPPQMRLQLTDDELTYLRKLARPLPTHFALGKNKKLQGLAAAIIKLWEKSPVVKIAVKVGILNTNNQQMSWELKRLTGGVLILRNKFFIILYRGKDFLSVGVADSISEREIELHKQQLQEEEARLKVKNLFHVTNESEPRASKVGTLAEFHDIQAKYLISNKGLCEGKVLIEAEKEKLEKELKEQERKLLVVLKLKIEKSEKVLAKLKDSWTPSKVASDQELLTEEERQTFRNIGLKMDEFLLLGRRGVYDGVIGSIHQHWKHREVVKVVTMQKASLQISYAARLLEIETGGVLVTVEKLKKGHAIILYRGKNYYRPLKLVPDNLLTKREALQKSIEIQRRGSLKFFAYQREQSIWELKQRLRYLEEKAKELVSGETTT